MDELSNWLAPQTVNLPPSGLVGSNPTSSTSTYSLTVRTTAFQVVNTGSIPVRCTKCSHRLMVRTLDFQSGNTGSIPVESASNSGIVGEMQRTVNPFPLGE